VINQQNSVNNLLEGENKQVEKMSQREVMEQLMFAHDEGSIDDEEFLLLYDLNKSKDPDFPYWLYDQFDLDKLSDDECKARFRFFKNDIFDLVELFTFTKCCETSKQANNRPSRSIMCTHEAISLPMSIW